MDTETDTGTGHIRFVNGKVHEYDYIWTHTKMTSKSNATILKRII